MMDGMMKGFEGAPADVRELYANLRENRTSTLLPPLEGAQGS